MNRVRRSTRFIVSSIKARFPEIKEIDVSITSTSDHVVKTTISLKHLGKHFAAVKRAPSAYLSLRLALKAITRQVERVKDKRHSVVGRQVVAHLQM